MRSRIGTGISRAVRQYSVALGFVLGQIAPLPTSLPRRQAAIVRTEPDQRDSQGFDPRERVSPRLVLTVPHHMAHHTDGQSRATAATVQGESDWLRRN